MIKRKQRKRNRKKNTWSDSAVFHLFFSIILFYSLFHIYIWFSKYTQQTHTNSKYFFRFNVTFCRTMNEEKKNYLLLDAEREGFYNIIPVLSSYNSFWMWNMTYLLKLYIWEMPLTLEQIERFYTFLLWCDVSWSMLDEKFDFYFPSDSRSRNGTSNINFISFLAIWNTYLPLSLLVIYRMSKKIWFIHLEVLVKSKFT